MDEQITCKCVAKPHQDKVSHYHWQCQQCLSVGRCGYSGRCQGRWAGITTKYWFLVQLTHDRYATLPSTSTHRLQHKTWSHPHGQHKDTSMDSSCYLLSEQILAPQVRCHAVSEHKVWTKGNCVRRHGHSWKSALFFRQYLGRRAYSVSNSARTGHKQQRHDGLLTTICAGSESTCGGHCLRPSVEHRPYFQLRSPKLCSSEPCAPSFGIHQWWNSADYSRSVERLLVSITQGRIRTKLWGFWIACLCVCWRQGNFVKMVENRSRVAQTCPISSHQHTQLVCVLPPGRGINAIKLVMEVGNWFRRWSFCSC